MVIAISTFYLPKGQGLAFRSLWLIPRISPAVIYVLLWKWFTYDTGFIPTVFGIDGNIMMELAPFTTIVFMNGFIGTSMGMIIFASALQAIPKSLLYASDIDGASKMQQIFYILLPQLKWPILFIATYQTLSLLTSFELIFLSTNGGPGYNTTMVWSLHIFQEALFNDFWNYRYGYGSALAIGLVIVGVILTLIYLKVFKFNEISRKLPIE